MSSRRTLVKIHVWLGMTIGAVWALQGITGAALVFNRDIQPLLLSPGPGPERLPPLGKIFERASEAAGADVSQVEIFGPNRSLVTAHFKNDRDESRTMVIDARTGAVLDRRDPEPMLPAGGSTWKWLLHLHESFLAGDRGLLLVGTSGLLLLSSLILGLYLGWPRRGSWRHVYSFGRWQKTQQRLFGWHRMVGLTAGFVLLVSVSCGAYLAFATTLRPLLVSQAGYRAVYKPQPVELLPAPKITVQQALDIARTRFPDAAFVRAIIPSKKAPIYNFRLLQPRENRRWSGVTTVAIDPATGKILDVYDPLTAPLANRLSDLVYPVHTGELGGIITRLLVMLAGLMVPVLYVTGLWAWIRRRKRNIGRAPAPVAAPARQAMG